VIAQACVCISGSGQNNTNANDCRFGPFLLDGGFKTWPYIYIFIYLFINVQVASVPRLMHKLPLWTDGVWATLTKHKLKMSSNYSLAALVPVGLGVNQKISLWATLTKHKLKMSSNYSLAALVPVGLSVRLIFPSFVCSFVRLLIWSFVCSFVGQFSCFFHFFALDIDANIPRHSWKEVENQIKKHPR